MTTTSVRSDPAPQIVLRPGATAAEIFAAYGLTCPPRVGTLRDQRHKTYGPAVARIAAKLGTPFMPWQRYVADVALEIDEQTGRLAYREVRLLVPRQSGKTTLILALKVHRALAMGKQARRYAPAQGTRQRILYAAQKGKDARDKFVDDHLPILEASPFVGRFRKRMTNGHEALIWDTGAYDGITAPTETAGHGKTLDLGIEDEAWAAEDNRLEAAYSPAMITRWSPQHWVVSTEGTERSAYLAAKVDSGRELVERGEPTTVCYLEWSNLDGARDDPATWWSCMPALGYTVTEDTIRSELEKLDGGPDPDEFDRAYLNRRKGSKPKPDPNMPTATQWANIADVRSQALDPVAIAVDVTPQRDHAAIAVAGVREDGRRHWEVIDHRGGTDWVVERLEQLREKWQPVAVGIDVAGPAGSLLVALKKAGFALPSDPEHPQPGDLWIPSAREAAAAFGAVVDAIRQDKVRHRDQTALNTAFTGARTRPLGDGTAWARRTAAADISPLVAVTIADAAYAARAHLIEDGGDPDAVWI